MHGIVNRFRYKGLQLLRVLDSWRLLRRCRLCAVVYVGDCNICENCEQQFPKLPALCGVCGELLKPGAEICGPCELEPPSFISTRALWAWAPPVSQLIKRFKFNGDRSIGLDLSRVLLKRLNVEGVGFAVSPDCLVAMPLHRVRLKERGYNQSLILAKAVGRVLELPVLDAVKRVRQTPAQSGLSRQQRQRNLRNAFEVTADVSGSNVLIVDDVMTTGSSAEELSATLLQAGARSVQVLVLCKVL